MPTPPSAVLETSDVSRSTAAHGLGEMVRAGLSAPRKQLQPAYFYDALGSALFDTITLLPEYAITRAEAAVLQTHGREIIAAAGSPDELIELGPGNGEKLGWILESCRAARAPKCVHLIDISASALASARARLGDSWKVEITVHQATFAEGLAALPRSRGRRLVLLLGSNIGNFSPDEARNFLRMMHRSLAPGDALLLGVDLVKPEPVLVAAYDDALGVTAAFNKNILLRINRALGANFDLLAFDHRAVWNAAASRVEMHLVSVVEQRIEISALDLVISFEVGETIWTESSYKYTAHGFSELVESAGFRRAGEWIHGEHAFLEALFSV